MLKVLIAEDDILIADILEDFLVAGGYDVCGVASTVDNAVTLADLHQPDLAVLDFRLADGGYGTQIRPRLKNRNNVGILYATGDGLHNELTIADGEAYLQKPYRMKDILSALRIVDEIKKTGANSSVCPRNFHILK